MPVTDDTIMSPVHPGEVLKEEYLDPLGLGDSPSTPVPGQRGAPAAQHRRRRSRSHRDAGVTRPAAHRLVYQLRDEELIIVQARYHY